MIESLTDEQTKLMDVYRDKWLEIGLSTTTLDVDNALAALKVAYATAGLTMPDKYEVYDSPFEAIREMKRLYNEDVSPNDFVYGSQDATWLSFYEYFKDVFDIKECHELQGLIDFAQHSGWALLYDEMVVLTHKPTEIKFDENNLTHCEDDYAIKYRDGTGIAMWHGTRLPPEAEEWILDKSTITPKVLFQWENIEERRCACEILGWASVLEHLDATVVDEDSDPTIGTLLEVELPDSGKEKFLMATDPNVGTKVGIPVPSDMSTALEANSWTYGIDKIDFKPEFRV